MFVVTFQYHGCPEVIEKFFQVGFFAHQWANIHKEKFSFVSVREVFH